jgi:hypothetical protein
LPALRGLTVVDDRTRECWPLVADASLSGLRLARELATPMASRGKPKMIVSDAALANLLHPTPAAQPSQIGQNNRPSLLQAG